MSANVPMPGLAIASGPIERAVNGLPRQKSDVDPLDSRIPEWIADPSPQHNRSLAT